jgi:nucleoside-diphosphate-sugar epimerase
MKRVLITGATGMLGANLARRLVADGNSVNVLARADSSRTRLMAIENDLTFLAGDMTDQASIVRTIDRAAPEVVYHLASTPFNPPISTAEDHFRVNALGTLYVLEALRKAAATTLVYTGTAAVYQAGAASTEDQPLKPATILGASKAAAATLLQTYAHLHGTRTVELRLFMPYGPWEHPRRLIPAAILSALDNKDLAMSQGTQQRDLVFVDDVVDALIRAGTSPLPPGSVINIGCGVGIPIRDIVQMIFALSGTRARPLLGALPTRPDEIMVMSANIEKARAALNWTPQASLEAGLRKTIAWIKANRPLLYNLGEPKHRQGRPCYS